MANNFVQRWFLISQTYFFSLQHNTYQNMATPQQFVILVCVVTDVAMKLILNERAHSDLKDTMLQKFKPRLDCDFTL